MKTSYFYQMQSMQNTKTPNKTNHSNVKLSSPPKLKLQTQLSMTNTNTSKLESILFHDTSVVDSTAVIGSSGNSVVGSAVVSEVSPIVEPIGIMPEDIIEKAARRTIKMKNNSKQNNQNNNKRNTYSNRSVHANTNSGVGIQKKKQHKQDRNDRIQQTRQTQKQKQQQPGFQPIGILKRGELSEPEKFIATMIQQKNEKQKEKDVAMQEFLQKQEQGYKEMDSERRNILPSRRNENSREQQDNTMGSSDEDIVLHNNTDSMKESLIKGRTHQIENNSRTETIQKTTRTKGKMINQENLIGRPLIPFFDPGDETKLNEKHENLLYMEKEDLKLDARVWHPDGYFIYPSDHEGSASSDTIGKTDNTTSKRRKSKSKKNGGISEEENIHRSGKEKSSKSRRNTGTNVKQNDEKFKTIQNKCDDLSSINAQAQPIIITKKRGSPPLKQKRHTLHNTKNSSQSCPNQGGFIRGYQPNDSDSTRRDERCNYSNTGGGMETGRQPVIPQSQKWALSAFQKSPDPRSIPIPKDFSLSPLEKTIDDDFNDEDLFDIENDNDLLESPSAFILDNDNPRRDLKDGVSNKVSGTEKYADTKNLTNERFLKKKEQSAIEALYSNTDDSSEDSNDKKKKDGSKVSIEQMMTQDLCRLLNIGRM